MIIIKIFGGLGNQMFQFAFGKALSHKLGQKLLIDRTYYDKENYPFDLHSAYYPYLLNKYNISEEYASRFICKYGNTVSKKKLYQLINPINRAFRLYGRLPIIFTKKNFSLSGIRMVPNSYLTGFWQNHKIIKDVVGELTSSFTPKAILPKTETIKKRMQDENSVSVHFRKGDYLSNPRFLSTYTNLTPNYYIKAMHFIERKVHNPVYYIFSDNYDWVRENIPLANNMVLMDCSIPDYEQLYLMTFCKNNIMANSSFSWWGAFLNINEQHYTICPKQWFKDVSKNISDKPFYLDNWILL